MYGRS
jgi:hypothetical protein